MKTYNKQYIFYDPNQFVSALLSEAIFLKDALDAN